MKNADRERPLRKADVGSARNCLGAAEIKELNLIADAFLNTAELRARRRQPMRLIEWEQALEEFLALSDLPNLRGAGSVSAKDAERMVHNPLRRVRRQAKGGRKTGCGRDGGH